MTMILLNSEYQVAAKVTIDLFPDLLEVIKYIINNFIYIIILYIYIYSTHNADYLPYNFCMLYFRPILFVAA